MDVRLQGQPAGESGEGGLNGRRVLGEQLLELVEHQEGLVVTLAPAREGRDRRVRQFVHGEAGQRLMELREARNAALND